MSSLLRSSAHFLREAGAGLLDLLFPPRCLVCDRLAEPFCKTCRGRMAPVEAGAPVPAGIEDARSVAYHAGTLRRAVVRLKFEHKTALADPLGELLAEELLGVMDLWQPDALVPVPIHWTREWERGYNQAELLAQAVGRRCGLPVWPALVRTRSTHPQVGLPRKERETNLAGAFAACPGGSLENAWIVLIDDVRTTGATLGACAAALRGAGAARVFALTVTFDA